LGNGGESVARLRRFLFSNGNLIDQTRKELEELRNDLETRQLNHSLNQIENNYRRLAMLFGNIENTQFWYVGESEAPSEE